MLGIDDFCNVNLERNHIFTMLTLYRAPVQGQAVPREVIHRWVGLTTAGQGQRSAGFHHAGGTSQNRGVLRRV